MNIKDAKRIIVILIIFGLALIIGLVLVGGKTINDTEDNITALEKRVMRLEHALEHEECTKKAPRFNSMETQSAYMKGCLEYLELRRNIGESLSIDIYQKRMKKEE